MTQPQYKRESTDNVTVHLDLPYTDHIAQLPSEPFQAGRQHLDLYLPSQSILHQCRKESTAGVSYFALPPLLVYVHGGLWQDRDKADYANIGHHWCQSLGVAVAIVNYRETLNDTTDGNSVHHPTHTRDLGRAYRWLADAQRGSQYGYDSDRLVLVGHSCGSHMIALLTSAPTIILGTVTDTDATAALSSIIGCVGIEGLFDMRVWVKDYAEWKGEIDKVFGLPESGWLDPIADSASSSDIHSRAPWLFVQSSEDQWVNARQYELYGQHLRTLGIDSRASIVTGGHFEVIEQIGSDQDAITGTLRSFVQSLIL